MADVFESVHTVVEYRETEWDLYWCPAEEREVLCPGPCPDGREHTFSRVEVTMSKVVPAEIVALGGKAAREWMMNQ